MKGILLSRWAKLTAVGVILTGCGGNRAASPMLPASLGSPAPVSQMLPDAGASPMRKCNAGEIATRQAGCVRVVQLALGERHSCALLSSGRVMCWGQNRYGELGDATGKSSSSPVLVQRLDDAVEIAAGRAMTCARTRAGKVLCWGMNHVGQADPDPARVTPPFPLPADARGGIAEPAGLDLANVRPWPSPIAGIEDAIGVALGIEHGCALREKGPIVCWGNNQAGQLGTSLHPIAFQRADLAAVPKATMIAAAGLQTCARTTTEDVWCWGGYNDYGELGTADKGPMPRRVPTVIHAVGLEIDPGRLCARMQDDHLICWGRTGDCAETGPRKPPAPATALGKVKRLVRASSGCFWCALRAAGDVDCSFDVDGKVERLSVPPAAALAAGGEHACALTTDGRVFCWGVGSGGQLGWLPTTDAMNVASSVEW